MKYVKGLQQAFSEVERNCKELIISITWFPKLVITFSVHRKYITVKRPYFDTLFSLKYSLVSPPSKFLEVCKGLQKATFRRCGS